MTIITTFEEEQVFSAGETLEIELDEDLRVVCYRDGRIIPSTSEIL